MQLPLVPLKFIPCMTINEGSPGATEANSRTMRGGRSLFRGSITQCIYPTPRFDWLDPER